MVPVAQWIARWTSNPEVVGSNPTGDDFLSIAELIPAMDDFLYKW